jgi:hypothetical protein
MQISEIFFYLWCFKKKDHPKSEFGVGDSLAYLTHFVNLKRQRRKAFTASDCSVGASGRLLSKKPC